MDKTAISKYILENQRGFKISKYYWECYKKLTLVSERLSFQFGRVPSIKELAKETGFSEETVEKSLACCNGVVSLDELLTNERGEQTENNRINHISYETSLYDDYESIELKKVIIDYIKQYCVENYTLEELNQIFEFCRQYDIRINNLKKKSYSLKEKYLSQTALYKYISENSEEFISVRQLIDVLTNKNQNDEIKDLVLNFSKNFKEEIIKFFKIHNKIEQNYFNEVKKIDFDENFISMKNKFRETVENMDLIRSKYRRLYLKLRGIDIVVRRLGLDNNGRESLMEIADYYKLSTETIRKIEKKEIREFGAYFKNQYFDSYKVKSKQ